HGLRQSLPRSCSARNVPHGHCRPDVGQRPPGDLPRGQPSLGRGRAVERPSMAPQISLDPERYQAITDLAEATALAPAALAAELPAFRPGLWAGPHGTNVPPERREGVPPPWEGGGWIRGEAWWRSSALLSCAKLSPWDGRPIFGTTTSTSWISRLSSKGRR